MARRLSPVLPGIAAALLIGAPGGSGYVLRAATQERTPSKGDLGGLSSVADLVQQAGAGDSYRYQLPLTQGELIRLTVTQRGLDVIVETRDADDRPIAAFGDAIGPRGTESVEIVAETAGTYSITIAASPETILAGSYAIHLAARRPATDLDRTMQQARRLRSEGERLEAQGRYDEAKSLLEQALDIAERARGTDGADAIAIVRVLAGNALERRDNARAD